MGRESSSQDNIETYDGSFAAETGKAATDK
jgi:hypothetical protein